MIAQRVLLVVQQDFQLSMFAVVFALLQVADARGQSGTRPV